MNHDEAMAELRRMANETPYERSAWQMLRAAAPLLFAGLICGVIAGRSATEVIGIVVFCCGIFLCGWLDGFDAARKIAAERTTKVFALLDRMG